MSDDIQTRLKTTSEECLKCYETWSKDDKDVKAREALQDAIHELRKVSSRLEIELAISERDQMAQKPIPIPPHRDSRGNRGPKNEHGGNNNKNDGGSNKPNVERKPTRRRSPPKKAAGGED